MLKPRAWAVLRLITSSNRAIAGAFYASRMRAGKRIVPMKRITSVTTIRGHSTPPSSCAWLKRLQIISLMLLTALGKVTTLALSSPSASGSHPMRWTKDMAGPCLDMGLEALADG
jgi:hypothetical protein